MAHFLQKKVILHCWKVRKSDFYCYHLSDPEISLGYSYLRIGEKGKTIHKETITGLYGGKNIVNGWTDGVAVYLDLLPWYLYQHATAYCLDRFKTVRSLGTWISHHMKGHRLCDFELFCRLPSNCLFELRYYLTSFRCTFL